MRKIELWDHVGLGIIIPCKSGVVISNQTGGTLCSHPEIEGVFLPFANSYDEDTLQFMSPEIDFAAHFEGPKWRGAGATDGIDLEDKEFLEKVLSKYNIKNISVDESKLDKSHEAWIHILLDKEEIGPPIFSGFGPYPIKAILTWANSE